jgi:hypothetical protein
MIKGCIVDLFETVDQKPDECVLDTGQPAGDCIYARALALKHGLNAKEFKHECQYWKPEKAEVTYEELKEAFMATFDLTGGWYDGRLASEGSSEKAKKIWDVFSRLKKVSSDPQ